MTSTLSPLSAAALTPVNEEELQALPVSQDAVGSEVFAARLTAVRAWQMVAVVTGLLTLAFAGATFSLASRKPDIRYIRIDSVGKATPIAYNDLSYSPREAEIRRSLEDWVKARYVRLQSSVAQTYQTNYYFVDQSLASSLMQADLRDKTVAKIISGDTPENNVAINSIQFLSLGKQRVQGGGEMATGQALIDMTKIFPQSDGAPKKEHWSLTVTFFLNPEQTAVQNNPKIEYLNPLGLTITEFHETQVLN